MGEPVGNNTYPGVPGFARRINYSTPAMPIDNIAATDDSSTVEIDITVAFTVINIACFACFCPVNLKSMKLYHNILHHGHPFFGLLMVVQGLCILDLLVCLSEAVTLWVEVPLWVCRCQIGTSHTIHLALSFAICSICAYRLVKLHRLPRSVTRYVLQLDSPSSP